MAKILKIYYVFFSIFIITASLLLEFDVISIQNLRLKKIVIPNEDRKNHSFVFIIPTHNCSDVTKKTLQSIFNQTYQNFRVIYIDDGSRDLTFEIAKDFAEMLADPRLKIIRHEKRKGALERLYEMMDSLENDEIVVYMKGNTWLTEDDALEKIHNLYKTYDIWFAYAQHLNFRTKEKNVNNAWCLSKNCLRRKSWGKPRLKTFYAGLFKKVHLEDFFFRGKFITDGHDEAYMFPMMEMADIHVAFLKEPLCAYIQREALEEDRPSSSSPKKCHQRIRKTTPYQMLAEHPGKKNYVFEKKADLIVFSYNRPLQLYSLLESIERYVQSYRDISVIYRFSNHRFETAYKELMKTFPKVRFLLQRSEEEFHKVLLAEIFRENSSPYILFSPDNTIIKEKFDLSECIDMLEKTNAYLFSLRLGKNINYSHRGGYQQPVPDYVQVTEDIFSWQMDAARGDWTKANECFLSLYRKKDLKLFELIHFTTPKDMEPKWSRYRKKYSRGEKRKKVALAYNISKALNIPLGIIGTNSSHFYSSAELLEKFEKGLKIHIGPLSGIENHTIYTKCQPIFVERKSKETAYLEREGR